MSEWVNLFYRMVGMVGLIGRQFSGICVEDETMSLGGYVSGESDTSRNAGLD